LQVTTQWKRSEAIFYSFLARGGGRRREKRVLLYRFTIVWDVAITARRVALQKPERGWGLLGSCGS
jgi:hypothetical protein